MTKRTRRLTVVGKRAEAGAQAPEARAEVRAAPTVHLEWRAPEVELRPYFSLSARQRERLLAVMMDSGGLQGACQDAGVSLGMVMGERLRNPAFRRVWDKAQQQRRAILETLLTDMVVRGLLPEPAPRNMAESREKFLATLAQSLAAGPGAPEPAAKRGRKPAEPRAAAPAPPPPDEGEELLRLIADVERKIAAAEAELGLNPPPPPAEAG